MRKVGLFGVLLLGFACGLASAQTTLAGAPATEIQVGAPYIPLDGVWHFQPGDSPVANGQFAWASPSYDDSGWDRMNLRPKSDQVNTFYGDSGFIPGWSARGYPKLTGFAWYRLRLHLTDPSQPLALKMPDHVDDAYQVFANGKLLGALGKFTSSGVVCYRTLPLVFPLPQPDSNGDMELAFRFYMEPWVLVNGASRNGGGMHSLPSVGTPAEMALLRERQIHLRILAAMADIFTSLLLTLTAAGAFWLWLLDRPRSTHLWLASALLLWPVTYAIEESTLFAPLLSQDIDLLQSQVTLCLNLLFWILFWRGWFGLRRSRLLIAAALLLSGVECGLSVWIYSFSTDTAPRIILRLSQMSSLCQVGIGLLLLATLLQAARKDRVGALLAAMPVLLVIIDSFAPELVIWYGIPVEHFFSSGISISIGDIAHFLLVLVLAVLVGRRFVHSRIQEQLNQQAIDQELEQARALQQQVLIPEAVQSATFAVETEYHPARTVGGDFFQAIPMADGALLIVVGDVSGKGMAAAMLVAVLVGAIRTRADETADPSEILRTLNERLLGRSGEHFATCVVAHLRPGGVMVVANAGHLPPYRNGTAMELAGSLPLGIAAAPVYEAYSIQLNPGDYLAFVTDGVPEARGVDGALLGFERLSKLAALPAGEIAKAAIAYGQDDDITVVGVRIRAEVATGVIAAAPESALG